MTTLKYTGYNGNYWYYGESNLYYGYDDNRDGVGDTPYTSPGGIIDYYPLVSWSRRHVS